MNGSQSFAARIRALSELLPELAGHHQGALRISGMCMDSRLAGTACRSRWCRLLRSASGQALSQPDFLAIPRPDSG